MSYIQFDALYTEQYDAETDAHFHNDSKCHLIQNNCLISLVKIISTFEHHRTYYHRVVVVHRMIHFFLFSIRISSVFAEQTPKDRKNQQTEMADSEDHRQKNILLAKNLNEVKMNLQTKKRNIASLQTQLREERQQNQKMKMEQVTILNRIDTLKKQLDDTFIKNTVGYFHLLKRLDEMHQDSIQSVGDTSMLGSSTTTANSSQLLFLEKFKLLSESFGESFSAFDGDNHEVSDSSTSNESSLANDPQSLSFNSFEIALNSTFVTNQEESVAENSELNRTFLTEKSEPAPENKNKGDSNLSPQMQQRTPLCEMGRNTNITMRRAKETPKLETPKVENKVIKRRSNRGRKKNRSDVNQMVKNMVLRCTKKVDYNESSFWRNK